VPTASVGPDPQFSVGSLLSAAGVDSPTNAGLNGVQTPKRYGEAAGNYTYDNASTAAQMDRARLGRLNPSGNTALRESLIRAGNDPDDVDAAILASGAGNPSGLKSLFAAPPKGPAPRILRTPSGYVSVTPGDGDPAAPVLGADGRPVMPIIAPPRSSRASNPNLEDPAHRNTRQALGAVRAQVNDAQGQLKAMDRTAPPLIQYPGVITGTAADSANANQFRQNHDALQQRADSLRGVSDQLAGSMSRAAGAVGAPGGGSQTILKPLTESQRTKAASNSDYKLFLTDKGYKLP